MSRKPAAPSSGSTTVGTCRGCGRAALESLFSLGAVPPVNEFLTPEEIGGERGHDLEVCWCLDCSLVQLKSVVPPAELFSHYQHMSSASRSNQEHLADLAAMLSERFRVGSGTKILEIGSNDGSLLAEFRDRTSKLLGVDPAENLAPYARERGVTPVSSFMTPSLADEIVADHGRQDLVLALNVVAHTPGVGELLDAVARLLAPDGTFMMEAVHVFKTVLEGQFDTVYHEHVYCFSLTALVPLLSRAGLAVVDVESIPTQGGSLRVFCKPAGQAAVAPAVGDSVSRLLKEEESLGVSDPSTYRKVGKGVRRFKERFPKELERLRERQGQIFALGAPARGVVIMNACGVGPDLVAAAVDDTPLKQGRLMPGVHVPVVSWDAVAREKPGAYVLLSWNYERELLAKLSRHVSEAEILVPFPEIRTTRLA